MKKTLPIIIVAVIIVGAGAFYGGMKYAEGKTSSQRQSFQNFAGGNFASGTATRVGRNGAAGGGFISGKILSKDASSITIQDQNGGSQIVFFATSTPIEKFDSGSASDLTVGEDVTVVGSTNSDGSISASSIQLGNRAGFSGTSGAQQ